MSVNQRRFVQRSKLPESLKACINAYGRIDILVNNAGIHYEHKQLKDITSSQLVKTFATNIFSFIWITREALNYMKKGSCIINTSSVTAYRGSAALIDYSATKGAIVSFTRRPFFESFKKRHPG